MIGGHHDYEQITDDEQIAATSADRSLANWQVDAAPLRTSIQPQEVHATSVVRLPGFEGISPTRLPQTGGLAQRRASTAKLHRAKNGSAFHDISQSRPPPALLSTRQTHVARDRASSGCTAFAEEKSSLGGDRRNGLGVASRQQLLRATQGKRRQNQAKNPLLRLF